MKSTESPLPVDALMLIALESPSKIAYPKPY